MALLIDNDIVHKLAQLDLLDCATPLLAEKYGDLQVLRTLKFKFRPPSAPRAERLNRRYGEAVIDKIVEFTDTFASEIDCEITDPALKDAMAAPDSDGLDIGEMQLLQALIDGEGCSMFTGDKRFLESLAGDANIAVHADKLTESFICFEQIITFLIKEFGFEFVKSKYIATLEAGLDVDKALRVCFGGGETAEEQRVNDNLEYHIETLKEKTEALLSTSDDWLARVIPLELVDELLQDSA